MKKIMKFAKIVMRFFNEEELVGIVFRIIFLIICLGISSCLSPSDYKATFLLFETHPKVVFNVVTVALMNGYCLCFVIGFIFRGLKKIKFFKR